MKLREAKYNTTCSLCGGAIQQGQVIVFGWRGNQTCRECIGKEAERRDAASLAERRDQREG